jgi:DNA-binding transcriptional MerR regulator
MVSERSHLSIGEVLALLQLDFPDVTISKIRFLESQGLLDPERTPSGYRKFYDEDIERLRWILEQQRDHFLPLRVIKDRLAVARAEGDAPPVSGPTAGEQPAAATTTAAAATTSPSADPARAALAEALDRRATLPSPDDPGRHERRVLDAGATDLAFTRDELAAACELGEAELERLESFGLLGGRKIGREIVFDGDALVVARLAGAFLRYGLEARHLRMFKVAAEREAGVYEQLVASMMRQRNTEARQKAVSRLEELAVLGQDLQAALLRQALRDVTG